MAVNVLSGWAWDKGNMSVSLMPCKTRTHTTAETGAVLLDGVRLGGIHYHVYRCAFHKYLLVFSRGYVAPLQLPSHTNFATQTFSSAKFYGQLSKIISNILSNLLSFSPNYHFVSKWLDLLKKI